MMEVRPVIKSGNDGSVVGRVTGVDDLPEEFDTLPREFLLPTLIDEGGVVLETSQEAKVELGRESLIGSCGAFGKQDAFCSIVGEQARL